MKFDTVVLGAGIVGVCVAVHLQKRGRQVALIDRKLPGNETSFGNAGLIQREGVYPYAFPRDLGTLLRYARNQSPDVRYHADAMLRTARDGVTPIDDQFCSAFGFFGLYLAYPNQVFKTFLNSFHMAKHHRSRTW